MSKTIRTSHEVRNATIIGEAIPWGDAKKQPGVYRVHNYEVGSPAMVVKHDGIILFVHSEFINDTTWDIYTDMAWVWRTSMQIPDEITI